MAVLNPASIWGKHVGRALETRKYMRESEGSDSIAIAWLGVWSTLYELAGLDLKLIACRHRRG